MPKRRRLPPPTMPPARLIVSPPGILEDHDPDQMKRVYRDGLGASITHPEQIGLWVCRANVWRADKDPDYLYSDANLPFIQHALAEPGIALGFNVTGATHYGCPGKELTRAREFAQVERAQRAGFRLTMLSPQSFWSGVDHEDPVCLEQYGPNEAMDRRNADLAVYCALVRARFPGIIVYPNDTVAAKSEVGRRLAWDYRDVYPAAVEEVHRQGENIAGIGCAWSFDRLDWTRVRAVADLLHRHGLRFGFKPADRHVEAVRAAIAAGIPYDDLILTDWRQDYRDWQDFAGMLNEVISLGRVAA